MIDYISAAERIYNPHYKWLSECFKDAILLLTLGVIFFILLLQPNGVI